MTPKDGTFTVNYPIVEDGTKRRIKTLMKITHFPVLINFATTGHKLQGKSLNSLIVAQWSRKKTGHM